MTSTLTISQLTKSFSEVKALDAVSLTVEPGSRVALLGHNGAGKSTMMKIILGLIPFESGTVEVCGAAPGSAAARTQVAYLPENAAFHPALTGQEQIAHYLSLRGESPGQALALLDRVGLHEAAKRRIGTYSKGMRQRVSRRDFYALLDGLAAEGAAILLSSHALTEVEARTDRILILSQGRMVASGTLADLRRMAALPVSLHVTARNGYASEIAAALPGAIRAEGDVRLNCAQDEKLGLLARITGFGDKVADIEMVPPSLEDIYSHFSRRDGQ
jgi:Cu-processing system ATP-binding protein